jgi:hypothetical protein
MPRTIYQKEHPSIPVVGNNSVPVGWDYIGEWVTSNASDTTVPVVWSKVPVMNWVNNAWVQLNEDPSDAVVDYTVTNIDWDSADVDVFDYQKFTNIVLRLYNMATGSPVLAQTYNLPAGQRKHTFAGLTENTPYRTNVTGTRMYGDGQSNNNYKDFRTTINPKPKTPYNLRVTGHTNSQIDLAWDNPAGSTSQSFLVYRLNEAGQVLDAPHLVPGSLRTTRFTGLAQDTKYQYYVVARNSSGTQSEKSNTVRWATGHEVSQRSGSLSREPLHPASWGSWNGLRGWHPVGNSTLANDNDLDKIRQGYWQKDPILTGTTNKVVPSEANGRYWGCVTYNIVDFINRVGGDVANALQVSEARIGRIYRYRYHGAHYPPDTQAYSWMVWHLTNTSPWNAASGQPPVYDAHRNSDNGYDQINSGYYHDNLILPARFGKALTTGWLGGTQVNGICLYRYENLNSGSGTDGYMALAGHGKREFLDSWLREAPWSRTEGYSNWTIYISGTYTVVSRSYLAPYAW